MRRMDAMARGSELRDGVSARPRRPVLTAAADALAILLLLDTALAVVLGRTGLGDIFFFVPGWAPLADAWPAVIALGVLGRCRPVVLGNRELACRCFKAM